MPNHCTNRLKLSGSAEDVAAFRDLMITVRFASPKSPEEVAVFDFERIIPMPECLPQSENTIAKQFFHILKRDGKVIDSWDWMNKFRDNCLGPFEKGILLNDDELAELLGAHDAGDLALAQAMIVAEKETGFTSWYDWSIAKWGTKWNAYSLRIESEDPFEIRFDTAWAPPIPVFEALAERFPNLHIHCSSFDEGWGFAAEGWFNPPEDGNEYEDVEPDDAIYERVYGQAPMRDEDEDEDEIASEVEQAADPDKPIWAM
ncbi:hypothetical protein G6L37_35205 [Agrobacterium rubi]|nr:hypothetical protein [Agrobacterium rubi]NTF23819.1 hypothetical protein [Agrobacterium rubi]